MVHFGPLFNFCFGSKLLLSVLLEQTGFQTVWIQWFFFSRGLLALECGSTLMRRKISELFQMLFISVHKLYSESLLPFFWVGPGFVTWQWLTRHYFSLNWCIFRAFDSWWLLGTASMLASLWKCCSGAFLLALQGKALIFIWFGCCLFNLPLGLNGGRPASCWALHRLRLRHQWLRPH